MNFFVFRSGVPFAYLAFLGVLLAVVVGGTVMSVMRARARPRLSVWPPAAVVLFALLVWAVNVYVDETQELNPLFHDADIVGEWTDGNAVLTLNQNGEFSCRGSRVCAPFGATGHWARRGDFQLTFQATDGRRSIQRVVRWGGYYYLTDMPDDPDLWDGKLTFQLRARAS